MKIVEYLQNIQENLVGIVFPVVITAFVSLFTVLANVILQIILQNSKTNWEQYKVMQKFYPDMRVHLLKLKIYLQGVEQSPISNDLKEASIKYISYKSDEVKYRMENSGEVQGIDKFIAVMDDFSGKLIEINSYLISCTLPRAPAFHPILKIKVQRMLANLQYFSFLWDEYHKKEIDVTIFQMEVENQYKKKFNGKKLDSKKVTKYICLLDKWVSKY